MRRVIVESPYSGDVDKNVEYARKCVKDCLCRGESPIASHLLYTQAGVLDDTIACERTKGIEAGLAWVGAAHAMVVYIDNGISQGMLEGIENAKYNKLSIEYRKLDGKA